MAEKAETEKGWIFPVGDEVAELGYYNMFTDMFRALERKAAPMETFYDGYVVNEIMDACYRSAETKKWEPVGLKVWRGKQKAEPISEIRDFDKDNIFVKEKRMPDGRIKVILKNKKTGKISQIEKYDS